MIHSSRPSRQRARTAWSRERLVRERSIALGQAIDDSTLKTYSSALNSYLTFVRLHDMPVEPTPDTLSFFAVFMSHHIEPRSVSSYLSGICQQLEAYFPNVRPARHSPLVERTMRGCLRLHSSAIKRKRALTLSDLSSVQRDLSSSSHHDDLLFLALLFTGFFTLLRLSELTFPNETGLRNWKKISKRSTVIVTSDQYSFTCLLTRQTVSLKAIISLLKNSNMAASTHSLFSPLTCEAGIQNSPFLRPFGSLPQGQSLPGISSSLAFGDISKKTLPASLCVLEERHLLLNMVSPPPSFNLSVVGLRKLSSYTFERALSSSRRSFTQTSKPRLFLNFISSHSSFFSLYFSFSFYFLNSSP